MKLLYKQEQHRVDRMGEAGGRRYQDRSNYDYDAPVDIVMKILKVLRIAVSLDFVHRPTPTLLGHLETANLNHWTTPVLPHLGTETDPLPETF
jgi:hypothetical protein